MASGATVFKGCKAGQGGKLNVEAPGGDTCVWATWTSCEPTNDGGNIDVYKKNFPVDNICIDQDDKKFNCKDCSPCDDGTISIGAQTSCTLCPPGTRSNSDYTECIACIIGKAPGPSLS